MPESDNCSKLRPGGLAYKSSVGKECMFLELCLYNLFIGTSSSLSCARVHEEEFIIYLIFVKSLSCIVINFVALEAFFFCDCVAHYCDY